MITLFFSVTLELDGIIFCLILASVWEAQRSTEGELYSDSEYCLSFLEGATLLDTNLPNAELAGVNFSHAILISTNFKGATRFGELFWDDWTLPICDAYINNIVLPDGTIDNNVRIHPC